jgi:hypothetical protein
MIRVHELKRYGLKVTISSLKSGRGLVEVALGSEARTPALSEFTGFWLDMVEISRQGTTAELNFRMEPFAKERRKSLPRPSPSGKELRTPSAG